MPGIQTTKTTTQTPTTQTTTTTTTQSPVQTITMASGVDASGGLGGGSPSQPSLLSASGGAFGGLSGGASQALPHMQEPAVVSETSPVEVQASLSSLLGLLGVDDLAEAIIREHNDQAYEAAASADMSDDPFGLEEEEKEKEKKEKKGRLIVCPLFSFSGLSVGEIIALPSCYVDRPPTEDQARALRERRGWRPPVQGRFPPWDGSNDWIAEWKANGLGKTGRGDGAQGGTAAAGPQASSSIVLPVDAEREVIVKEHNDRAYGNAASGLVVQGEARKSTLVLCPLGSFDGLPAEALAQLPSEYVDRPPTEQQARALREGRGWRPPVQGRFPPWDGSNDWIAEWKADGLGKTGTRDGAQSSAPPAEPQGGPLSKE